MLSVTRTAFPTSNAATVAVKKPLKAMPCSSRIKRLVHRIRLKPMKKKIVGGSTCRICTSHQSKARWGNDTGAETETLGWLTPYLPKYRAESPARLCATFIKPTWCASTPALWGAGGSSRSGWLARLAQDEEPGM